MVQFMRAPLPAPSQVRLASLNADSLSQNRRERIMNEANSSENFDAYPHERYHNTQQLTLAHDDPYLTLIPINPEFRKLFIALNATLTCISIHLVPRGRCIDVDETLVEEIVTTIIDQHSVIMDEEEDEDGSVISEHDSDTENSEEEDERSNHFISFEFP